MKKYNILAVISFLAGAISASTIYLGVIFPLIIIGDLVLPIVAVLFACFAKRNEENVSEGLLPFVSAGMILGSLMLFLFAFIFPASLMNVGPNIFSLLFAVAITIAGIVFYNTRAKKKCKYVKLVHCEKKDDWTHYDFVTHPYGYDFMLNLCQMIINYSDKVGKAAIAEIIGAPEKDCTVMLTESNGVLKECEPFKRETGVISLGVLIAKPYLDRGVAMQISMYNQTNRIHIAVSGKMPKHFCDSFIDAVVEIANTNK